MERITNAMLEAQVLNLNKRLGRPVESWSANGPISRGSGNQYVANIGNIGLSYAYGGVMVGEIVNEGGGVRNLTPGHDTKRSTYGALRAMHAVLDSKEWHHREVIHVVPADWCPACEALGRKVGVTN